MANADWAGGVLDAIETAVLAKLMPTADAPTVAGPAAREMALDLLGQIRTGEVNRALLGDEYSAFLTPARLAVMSKSRRWSSGVAARCSRARSVSAAAWRCRR